MTAVTHAAGGIVFTGFMLTNTLIQLDTTVAAITVFASLAPDIDHPRSTISKIVTLGGMPRRLEKKMQPAPRSLLYWLFRPFHLPEIIEQRFLHRGVVHSLLASMVASVMFFCVVFFFSDRPVSLAWTFWNGYFSHLLMDVFNPTGVPFYYPVKKMVRMPEDGEGCIPVGWENERWLFFAMVIPAILMLIVARLGIQTVLYRFNPSAYGAVAEIQKYPDIFFEACISGYGERSLTHIEECFNVLGIKGRDEIVLEKDGRVFFINQMGGNIATDKVIVRQVGPKKFDFQTVELRRGVISQIADKIGGYGFVNGEILVRVPPPSPVSIDDYMTVRIIPLPNDLYAVTMEYFPLSSFRKLFAPNIFIHSGRLQITRITYEKSATPETAEGGKQ